MFVNFFGFIEFLGTKIFVKVVDTIIKFVSITTIIIVPSAP